MPDYRRMYTVMVDVVEKALDGMERILDEVNGRAVPDSDYYLQLKKDLTDALQKAEDIYIDTADDGKP